MSEAPPRLVVGSDNVISIPRRGLGSGRLHQQTERGPGRPRHAVPEGTRVAVCGYEPGRVWDAIAWPGGMGSSDDLCTSCHEVAGT
jgi:hypothetical protein